MDVLVFARNPSGGIRTYFYYVYGSQELKSIRFSVLAPHSVELEALLSKTDNVTVQNKVDVGNFGLLVKLLKCLVVRRPSLVHSHGFTAGFIAAIPSFIFGVPHVMTTHDVFSSSQFVGASGRIKRVLIKWAFSFVDVINPVGSDAADNFSSTFPMLNHKKNIIAVRNGIPSNCFLSNETRNLRLEANVPNDSVLLGFFGRFMAQKGFGLIIDAIEVLNKERTERFIHVACFGWGGYIREEQEKIKRRGLDSFFHFFPGTNRMAEAIRGVDAVVMPSKWEACPLLPMEVMVAGRPLIASNCIGMKEVVADSPALVFDVGSLEGLLEKIRSFAMDQVSFQRHSEQFRQEAASRFDVKRTAEKLLRVFEDTQSNVRPSR